ncbi:MAG: class I adenylate-forming enzyme family protein [Acidimicrobiales bacterium]
MTLTTPVCPAPATSLDFVGRLLHRQDRATATRPALASHTGDGWVERTYADLDTSSVRVAAWLEAAGVAAGDRVAILGPAGPQWVAALLGAWRAGAVAVPLDAALGPTELAPLVERSRPAAVVVGDGQRALLAAAAPGDVAALPFTAVDALPGRPGPDVARSGGEAALVVWTSGTSGRPKGVTLSFDNVAYVVDAGCAAHRLDGTERWLSVLPLNHTLELSCAVLPALATGACVAFAPGRAAADVAAAMRDRRFTRMTAVPVLLTSLLRGVEAGARDGRLRAAAFRAAGVVAAAVPSRRVRCLLFAPVHRRLGGGHPSLQCGGAPLDPAVRRRLELLGVPVFGGYGLTETAPTVAMEAPGSRRAGSVGLPLPGTQVRIVDGEIQVRSPGVMLGYWQDPAATTAAVGADGWFRTGDLGRLDADGFLYVTGRAKSLVVLPTGKKVQPEEVEAALEASDLLDEACVVGWAPPTGPRAGTEQVCAVVVASAGLRARCPAAGAVDEVAAAEVARCTAGLAAFKRPGVVRVVPGPLPRTPKRSVRRADVVRLLESGAGSRPAEGPEPG